MEVKGRHYFITGRVQGVFFRDSTFKKAIELNILGWVKNLDDGRVECHAFGTSQQLALFEKWLWDGPPLANVTDIEATDVPNETFTKFEIR